MNSPKKTVIFLLNHYHFCQLDNYASIFDDPVKDLPRYKLWQPISSSSKEKHSRPILKSDFYTLGKWINLKYHHTFELYDDCLLQYKVNKRFPYYSYSTQKNVLKGQLNFNFTRVQWITKGKHTGIRFIKNRKHYEIYTKDLVVLEEWRKELRKREKIVLTDF